MSSIEKVLRTFWPASVFLIAVTALFCLPGKALPSHNWFDIIHLDKWIHVFLFATLVVLWIFPFTFLKITIHKFYFISLGLSLVMLLYGIVMEFVQHFWIPDRSFDLFDIISDGVGCIIGLFVTITRSAKRLSK